LNFATWNQGVIWQIGSSSFSFIATGIALFRRAKRGSAERFRCNVNWNLIQKMYTIEKVMKKLFCSFVLPNNRTSKSAWLIITMKIKFSLNCNKSPLMKVKSRGLLDTWSSNVADIASTSDSSSLFMFQNRPIFINKLQPNLFFKSTVKFF